MRKISLPTFHLSIFLVVDNIKPLFLKVVWREYPTHQGRDPEIYDNTLVYKIYILITLK